MRKLTIAVVATIILGGSGLSVAVADNVRGTHHRFRHQPRVYAPYIEADPAVRDGYVMNGNFDWRRRGEHVPWYGHGYTKNCVAWEQNAYHYACDPNSRY
jgi:hypothetical protein